MEVTCPSGSQSVGGTGAMAATLADAERQLHGNRDRAPAGACALTYTLTIGPVGG